MHKKFYPPYHGDTKRLPDGVEHEAVYWVRIYVPPPKLYKDKGWYASSDGYASSDEGGERRVPNAWVAFSPTTETDKYFADGAVYDEAGEVGAIRGDELAYVPIDLLQHEVVSAASPRVAAILNNLDELACLEEARTGPTDLTRAVRMAIEDLKEIKE